MDYSTILGVIVGGLFTLTGGYLQASSTAKKQREENKNNVKLKVLTDVMGNRAALSTSELPEGKERIREYKKPFFSALNQVPLIFNDNKDVVERFEEFHFALNSDTSVNIVELLYKLIKSMYEDLGMISPAREHFTKISF